MILSFLAALIFGISDSMRHGSKQYRNLFYPTVIGGVGVTLFLFVPEFWLQFQRHGLEGIFVSDSRTGLFIMAIACASNFVWFYIVSYPVYNFGFGLINILKRLNQRK